MPLIVDPSAQPLPPPEVVTSADGVLSVERDEAWAGVRITFDFTNLTIANGYGSGAYGAGTYGG